MEMDSSIRDSLQFQEYERIEEAFLQAHFQALIPVQSKTYDTERYRRLGSQKMLRILSHKYHQYLVWE